MSARTSVDVAIVGAGFGGLTMAHSLAQRGIDDVVILERDDGVGGTWRANSYPGAACDVPAHLYSLSFAPNPWWSRTYAGQAEILAYIEECYDRFDVRGRVRSGVTVERAVWDEAAARWQLRDANGGEYSARVVVWAIGMFHTPVIPTVSGRETFAGAQFHSARWDHGVHLQGARVGVIGTGATAIQVVPAIVDDAAHTTVFQRTPAWILPRIDEPFTPAQQQAFADDPSLMAALREQLAAQYEANTFFLRGDAVAQVAADIAAAYREQVISDPELRERLTPRYPIGCKRVLVSSDFYPAVQRDDATLVTEHIAEVTATGVRTADGAHHPLDVIVWCTGFAATDYLRDIQVVGRAGEIHSVWNGTPRAHLGMSVPGFPNSFMMYGPNTNQAGNSIILVLEAQAEYIAQAVSTLRDQKLAAVDVTPDAMARYATDFHSWLDRTVWSECNSYFRTADGEVVTQLPHPFGWYAQQTECFDLHDYDASS